MKGAPYEKTPPSDATSQYPSLAGSEVMLTIGASA